MPKKTKIYTPKPLFGRNVNELVWGVTPGGHVAHLIDPAKTSSYTAISDRTMSEDKFDNKTSFYEAKKVSQGMVYNNVADNATAKKFKKIAKEADSLYQSINVPQEYKDALIDVKNYLLASGRSEQQETLKKFKEKATKILAKHENNDYFLPFQLLANDIVSATVGSLKPDKDYFYDKHKIEEPINRFIGKFGKWVKTDEVLFPHEPSPNDVKQGYGVNDCFLLSPLVYLAEKNPDKIKKMMKDNLDGTVTGEFFVENPETRKKEPVYITVNKTVNKLAGSANVYASSALWVQMMEKLYIKFRNEYGNKANSYNSIDFYRSDEFLNAITKDKKYIPSGGAFGFGNSKLTDLYRPNSKYGNEYSTYEKDFYDFIHKHVNENKESIMVGGSNRDNSMQKKIDASNKFAKSHGIRTQHVYAILGAFEKDGKKYIQVRDPRGLFRSKYDNNGKLVNDQSAIAGTFKGGVSNMGTFNLEVRDFSKVFDSFAAIEEASCEEFNQLRDKWDAEMEEQKNKEQKLREKMLNFDDVENEFEDMEQEAEELKAKDDANNIIVNEFDDLSMEDFGDDELPDKNANAAENVGNNNREYNEKIYDMLNQPGGLKNVRAFISYLTDDLNSTYMFFKFKNTQNFTAMSDKLNAINKAIKNPNKEVNIKALAADLTELSTLASTYADAKYKSIEDNIAKKHEEPSMRAVHRLSDAIMLSRLSEGVTQLIGTEYGFAESLQIMTDDIRKLQGDLAKSERNEKNIAMENRLKHTSDIIAGYLEKNPDIKERADILKAQREMNTEEVKEAPVKENKNEVRRGL